MSRGYTYLVTLVDYPAEVGEKDGQHLLVGGGQQVDQAMHLQVGGEEGQAGSKDLPDTNSTTAPGLINS